MSAYDVEPGDNVHAGDPVTVDRYTTAARINHWITAASLVLLLLSGLALFHPKLFFLTGLFGGGQNTRAIHPWIGVLLFFAFLGLFIRFWRANLWRPEDGTCETKAERLGPLPRAGRMLSCDGVTCPLSSTTTSEMPR